MEISLSQSLFHIETQFEADLTEPGFGARAHMECITSHSEGVERGKNNSSKSHHQHHRWHTVYLSNEFNLIGRLTH